LSNRAPASTTSGEASASADTAQPLPTQPIPNPLVPRISLDEAQTRLEQGQAVLIDVRSRESYDQAHAAGALSFPEEEVDARLGELPRDKDLILYCT
jgi:3-mercaptopyruvate sulfurtransferase SseA